MNATLQAGALREFIRELTGEYRGLAAEIERLRALLHRAMLEMIRVGNDLNWDGQIANQSLADTINEIRAALGKE